ncbi:MAG: hypothetical protein KGL95_13215, partial [Patescibacteria group bacterium]|nr:hypothetical protein [Patescibacteria group bacterium]
PKQGSWKEYNAKAKSSVIVNILGQQRQQTKFLIKTNDMYRNEIKDFVNSIIKEKNPSISGWEGLKTLKIGMAALLSAKENKIIKL